MSKKRVLFISPFPFYPLDGGGRIGVYNDLCSLSRYCDVDILLPEPKEKHHIDGLKELRKSYKVYTVNLSYPPFIERNALLRQAFNLFKGLFLKYSFPFINDFYDQPEVIKLIQSDYDFVQLEHSWWYHHRLKSRQGKLVLTEHNCEYEYWRHMGYALLKSKQYVLGICYVLGSLKIFYQEREAVLDADLVLAISPREQGIIKQKLGRSGPICVLPSSIDAKRILNWSRPLGEGGGVTKDCDYVNLIYVGSFDAPQTADGAIYFIKEIMPLLRKSDIKFKFFAVGRGPQEELVLLCKENSKDVILTGLVEDVKPYIADADIYVVPLRYGSGIRIKIMEAMMMGKPIVSTRKGAEGMDLTDCGIFLTNTPGDFAETVLRLARDEGLRKDSSKRNLEFAKEHFDRDRNFDRIVWPYYQKEFNDSSLRS